MEGRIGEIPALNVDDKLATEKGPGAAPTLLSTESFILRATKEVLGPSGQRVPIWLRGIVALVLLLVAGLPYLSSASNFFKNYAAKQVEQTTNSTLSLPDYYKNVKVDSPISGPTHSDPDKEHWYFHTVTKGEQLAFKPIDVEGLDGKLFYDVFPSDGCIAIKHIKTDGTIIWHLVRDQNQPGRSAAESSHRSEDMKSIHTVSKVSPSGGMPPLAMLLLQRGAMGPRPESSPVQAGCMNPHPGQFRTWNVPVNQCLVQVYRQFLADGCTHYQIFNTCANQWDPSIYWTFCNPSHRW